MAETQTRTDQAETALREGRVAVLWREMNVRVGTTCFAGFAAIPKGTRIRVEMSGESACIYGADRPLPLESGGTGEHGLSLPVWEIAKHCVAVP